MDELIKALDENGHSRNPSMTLSSIIANTRQDAQYSPKSYANYNILCKYEEQYGHLTVEVLRKLTK
jgi:uncharacterized protein YozE (UPF0346 family)